MNREARLEKMFALAKELTKEYTYEKKREMTDLCQDDIFYSEGENNEFYIEDDFFIYAEH
jgi:hypothetical protein